VLDVAIYVLCMLAVLLFAVLSIRSLKRRSASRTTPDLEATRSQPDR
jgi:hypothetical protein